MRFEVLGPLRATAGAGQLALGTRDQQRVLALLLAAPEGLTADRLVDELFGETPPASAHHLVQVYVSRLRGAFAGVDREPRINFDGIRYVLRVGVGEVDANDLTDGAALAHEELAFDPAVARGALYALERLWRGRPYDGLGEESPLLRNESARLERCYLQVVTDRITADLTLGRHEEVLADLERLTGQHPYVEPFWNHRMLALYRSGRAAEALQVCAELRHLLADDLGVDPSPMICDLEGRILAQDPTLLPVPLPAPTNLPVPTTSFVGRSGEIAAVIALLDSSRLVTLTGPGGVGKTRLAIEVAARKRNDFPDGVWWLDLATILEPSIVAAELARVLRVPPVPETLLAEAIGRALARKRTLLVLDNCEHVAPVVAELVAGVLSAAPGVRVVATSRVPLHLAAEMRWPVPGMGLTASGDGDGACPPEAVRLFAERAAATGSTSALASAEIDAVTELCRRLDGLPLAIEMAASRAGVLSVDQLVRSLDDRFGVLRRSAVDVVDRHQTLQAALDWSYDQLDGQARVTFDRLAVFVGAFDLDAAARVARGSDELRAADLVTQLVDASMVAVERRKGRPRFRLLETLRAYGTRHLLDRGDLEPTREAHAEHFLTMLVRAGEVLKTPAFAGWTERIAAAYPDVRQALAWSLLHHPRERTLETAAGLFGHWFWTGDPREARRWSAQMLDGSDNAPPRLRAAAHECASFAANLLGPPDQTTYHAAEALRLFRLAGDRRGVALALFGVSSGALQVGDLPRVVDTCRQAVAVCEESGERWARAGPLGLLAVAYTEGAGPLDEARTMAEEALELHRQLGDVAGQVVLNPLPMIALRAGDLTAAERHAREMVAVAVGTGWEAAGRSFLAQILMERGDLDHAEAEARRALPRAVDAGLETWVRIAVRNLARLAVRRGDFERAAVLSGASRRNMPPYGLPTGMYDDVESACRDGLGVERADALMARGLSMPDGTLLDLALRPPEHDLQAAVS